MWKLRSGLAVAILVAVPALVTATEGLDVPEALEKTVSLDGLTGISFFFARAYNENAWLYAVYCAGTMGLVGVLIAVVTDVILKAIGMEVHKIEHRE